MKKTIFFLLGWLVSLNICADGTAPDSEGMDLDARQWTRNVVLGWNLGNSLECPTSETEWGNPKTTKEMIHAVRAAGFNAIRIPVRWTGHLTDKTAMTIDQKWLARVKEIVDWCLAEDMYVMINDHHEEWYDRNPYYSKQQENNRKLAAMWTNIATYFRDYGERLAFGGTNETTVNWGSPTKEQQEVQNSYNQTFVDAVRATGGKNYYRNLIVQTFACNPYHGLNGFVIPEDKVEGRMSVEFHYYDPYGYGLLTGNKANDYYYWGEAYKEKAQAKGYKVPSDNEQTQANLFTRIQKAWGEKGLGVIIGEFGVTNHYTNDDRATQQENMSYYLKTTVANARERGFAPFVWDNNGFGNGNEKFGIFKRSSNMAVGNEYFLKGLTEGSKQEYKEPEEEEGGTVVGGDVFWEGNQMLDWGSGLQLTIPAETFKKYGNDVRLAFYYTTEFNDYDDLQLFYGDWDKVNNVVFTVDGMEYTKDFSPSQHHGVGSGEDCVTTMSFKEEVNNLLQQKGMVIQGHGLRMKKVVLAKATGILSVKASAGAEGAPFYSLSGQRTAMPRKGIYIRNGRKFVAK